MSLAVSGLPAFPAPILRAIQTVHFIKEFKILTASARQVLAEIATRLDLADPAGPFWFKRDKAALRLGLSRRAIYYALSALEKAGYIIRLPQPLSSEGYFGCARMRATENLLKLLNLPASDSQPSAKNAASPINHKNNLKKQPASRISFSEMEEKRKTEENQKPGPTASSLWKDPALQKLLNLGLSRWGVFALMGQAKKAGQRLSEVVNYLGSALDQLDSPRGVFAYIRACLKSGRDFGAALKDRLAWLSDDSRRRQEQERLVEDLSRFKAQAVGRVYQSLKTGDFYQVEDCGARNRLTNGWITIYELFTAVKNNRMSAVLEPVV